MTEETTPGTTGRRRFPTLTPRHGIALAVTVVTVVFIAQNRDPVRISLLNLSLSAPLWTVLVVMVLVGVVVGAVLARRQRRRG